MALKIEVTSIAKSRETSNGTIHFQDAYRHKQGDKYPARVQLSIEGPNKAYPPGMYELDIENSHYIGQYDSLTFSRFLVLNPVK